MLKYPPFAASAGIVAASRSAPPLRRGASGTAVGLLQGGLIQLGIPLPKSTKAKGAPDQQFGAETEKAVRRFQSEAPMPVPLTLLVDGVAGKNTITKMDEMLFKLAKPIPPSPPVKPPLPRTADYEVGVGHPPRGSDAGAGIWNSKPKEATYVALGASIVAALPVAYGVIGGDAAAHIAHYFTNRGSPYTIDLEGMVSEVPSAKEVYEDEVSQAREFVEKLPLGSHSIRSRKMQNGYNTQNENRNWYFAIGGYSVWGTGNASVREAGARRQYELDFEYSFYDRYNWDNGKQVTFAGITVTDKFMGEFHRQGLAREFDCLGSLRRHFTWADGEAISRGQLHPGGGRA